MWSLGDVFFSPFAMRLKRPSRDSILCMESGAELEVKDD